MAPYIYGKSNESWYINTMIGRGMNTIMKYDAIIHNWNFHFIVWISLHEKFQIFDARQPTNPENSRKYSP